MAEFAFARAKRQADGEIVVNTAMLDDVFADDITLPAVDGYPLAATLFLARGTRRHAILISSATATPRKIYRGFASGEQATRRLFG